MKKIIFLLISIISAMAAAAQNQGPVPAEVIELKPKPAPVVETKDVPPPVEVIELKSKKGIPILPEKGEWSLGVSAETFLNYLGNLNNSSTSNNPPSFDDTYNPANMISVFGKYMVDAKTAYRVRFNASVNSTINKAVVAQNEITPDPLYPAFTEDWRTTNSQQILLAAGYEKRRGKSRVQGVYGGEVILAFSGSKQKYQYGNPISQDFNAPITNDFGSNILSGSSQAASSRKVEENFGATITMGARGFLGVEYFIGPKISLGAEFGYSFLFQNGSRGLVTSERWNSLTSSVLETKTDVSGNYFTFLGTNLDNMNGSINLLFYF